MAPLRRRAVPLGSGRAQPMHGRLLARNGAVFRWRSMAPSSRAVRRAWMADVITEIHALSRRTYGWAHIRAELADAYGQRVNKKLIRVIMGELGISGLPARGRAKPSPIHRATTKDRVKRIFGREGPQPAVDDRHHRAQDSGGQALLLRRLRRLRPFQEERRPGPAGGTANGHTGPT